MAVTHRTKGIVLKAVPYGDTSVIVTILTQLFGVQHYIVKGARTATKKQTAKMVFLQPASILDLVVYHHPLKHLNFIKEINWASVTTHLQSHVVRNAVALFLIELLQKCIKQPDENSDQFYFAEEILLHINQCDAATLANLPLYISVHFPETMGLQLADDFSETNNILDLAEGCFVADFPKHSQYCTMPHSQYLSQVIKAQQPSDLQQLVLSKTVRKEMLEKMKIFYQLHFADFGTLRSMDILSTVLS